MHRAREHRLLSFNPSNGGSVSVRQPGEHRNLRVGPSVGGENLISFRIVRDPRIGKSRSRCSGRSAADFAYRSYVACGRAVVYGGRVVAEVGDPQLVVLE